MTTKGNRTHQHAKAKASADSTKGLMTRARVLSTLRQLQHLQKEVERITAELHFSHLQKQAKKLWEAHQPLENARIELRQWIADNY